ncbi:MAG: hypothetical protein LBQ23_02230 [Puniceicoccales bacterium]|jgi:hypothetical protein|nr:hypothetical protein [Puniceicoccales bacterium]
MDKLTNTNVDCGFAITPTVIPNDQVSHGESTENLPLPSRNPSNAPVPFANRSLQSAEGNRDIQPTETEKPGLQDMPRLSDRIAEQDERGVVCCTFGSKSRSTAYANASNDTGAAASVVGDASSGDDPSAVSGLSVNLVGKGNQLTAHADAVDFPNAGVAASVIGAASPNNTSIASEVVVNANGSQNFIASAYAPESEKVKVNTFGADNTDKGENDLVGWRVGIYASGTYISDVKENDLTVSCLGTNSTVNIVAAKLAESSEPDNDGVPATKRLANDQGTDFSNYARAFALGEDFKIHIGGRWNPTIVDGKMTDVKFEPIPPNGGANEVNVFGAIAPARNIGDYPNTEDRVKDSSLAISNGWTANVYGPIEGLKAITVEPGSTLNTYGSLKNITISGGEICAFGKSNDIGTLFFDSGTLLLCKRNDAEGHIPQELRDNFDPSAYAAYAGNFGHNGKLSLNDGSQLIFNINPGVVAPIIVSQTGSHIIKANGYIEIDPAHDGPAISLQGGQFSLFDGSTRQKKLTSRTEILLIGCEDRHWNTVFELDESRFKFVEIRDGVWDLQPTRKGTSLFAEETNSSSGLKFYRGIGLVAYGKNNTETDSSLLP